MTRPVKAQIHIKALQHNLRRVKNLAPHSKVAAVVKANAYGHGAVEASGALADADALAVVSCEEALAIRESGARQPVILLEGFFSPDEIDIAVQHHFIPVIHHQTQLDWLQRKSQLGRLPLWIKVNTGMNRLGFAPGQMQAVRTRLKEAGIHDYVCMTHFACADDVSDKKTKRQIRDFQTCVSERQKASMANSAAIIAWPKTHLDWVRPGIMLYGVSPMHEHTVGRDYDLRPVMTLRSQIIATHLLKAGESIGYGGEWICPQDMPVGIIAAGYGDGYPRHAPSGTPVLVADSLCQLIGRVSMDMICVDLRPRPHTQVGDTAVLWGQGLAVEVVARHAGTIAYELLCGVTKRVAFEYL